MQKVCELIEAHKIDCELGTRAHTLQQSRVMWESCKRKWSTSPHSMVQKLAYLPPDSVAERTSAQGFYGGLLDDGCKHLHPLKYTVGLARAAVAAGVRIYEGTRGRLQPTGDPESADPKRLCQGPNT